MKSYIKWMLLLLVIMVVALPMLLKGPEGQPIMAFSDWLPSADTLADTKARLQGRARELMGDGGDKVQQAINQLHAEQGSLSPGAQSMAASPAVLSAASGKMYKWQDQQGQWHFSTNKPVEVVELTIEQLPDIENVMEAPVNSGGNSSNMGGVDQLLEKIQELTQ